MERLFDTFSYSLEKRISFWDRLWERDYTTSTRKIFESRESKDRPIPSGEREREREREGAAFKAFEDRLLMQASTNYNDRSVSKKKIPSDKIPLFPRSRLSIFRTILDIHSNFQEGGERERGGWNGFETVVVQTEDVTHRLPREKERIDRFLCQSWDKRIRNWIFIEG